MPGCGTFLVESTMVFTDVMADNATLRVLVPCAEMTRQMYAPTAGDAGILRDGARYRLELGPVTEDLDGKNDSLWRADRIDVMQAPIGDATALPGDPPEPTAPVVECSFERVVRCEPELPTLSAVGPPGFESCPLIGDAAESTLSIGPPPVAALSAAETRRARRRSPRTCCYVEYVATACD